MLPVIISTLDDPQDRNFIMQLYLEYEKLLFSTAWKFTSSHHDAEEIVQDSLERLIRKTSVLRQLERCTLVAYIVSTVRNTAINHLRKAGRIKLAETDIDSDYSRWMGFKQAMEKEGKFCSRTRLIVIPGERNRRPPRWF